tara:strand:+ start:3097 stop:3321 length:225 start_codon:yes stop_codon:yes gene_type:complete
MMEDDWEDKYNKDQANRRLHFARFCWKHMNELTPKGRITWEKRFEQMEGISLQDYAKERMKERNQKEKKLSHNK